MNGMHTTPHPNKPSFGFCWLSVPAMLTPFQCKRTIQQEKPLLIQSHSVSGWGSHTFIISYGTFLHPDLKPSTSREGSYRFVSPSLSLPQKAATSGSKLLLPSVMSYTFFNQWHWSVAGLVHLLIKKKKSCQDQGTGVIVNVIKCLWAGGRKHSQGRCWGQRRHF